MRTAEIESHECVNETKAGITPYSYGT